jgi:2-polyprenyl-3-methyl-5-hydroxy-6-metoxy-1,4-benzoquinol methylase
VKKFQHEEYIDMRSFGYIPSEIWWKDIFRKIFGTTFLDIRVRERILFKLMKNIRGRAILDLGCGYGVYSSELKWNGMKPTGVDYELKNVEVWKKINSQFKDEIPFVMASVLFLPFKNGVFDVIICTEVLEHLEEDKKALIEMNRILKKRGSLLLTTPSTDAKSFLHGRKKEEQLMYEYGHVRIGYKLSELQEKLSENGFKIIDFSYYSQIFGRLAGDLFHFDRVFNHWYWFPLLFALTMMDSILPKDVKGNGIAVKAIKIRRPGNP